MPALLTGIAAPALLSAAALFGPQNGVYTPRVGSAERTAIIGTMRGDDDPRLRYTFKKLRVLRDGNRAIAYAEGEGGVGGFQLILTREGSSPWRRVWGEGDGGSDSCGRPTLADARRTGKQERWRQSVTGNRSRQQRQQPAMPRN